MKTREITELPTRQLQRISRAAKRTLISREKRLLWGRHKVRAIAKRVGCSVKELIDGRSFSGPMTRAKKAKKATKRNGK